MQRKTWLYYNLDSVWSNHLGKKQHTVAMEQMEIYDLGLKDAKGKILKKTTDDVNISKKCSQCEYASSVASNLRKHLKMHSGEKSNKCNLCDYASSRTDVLKAHLKIHSGEKSNKCSLCDYASSRTDVLRTHLKRHSGEKSNKCSQWDYASSDFISWEVWLFFHET